MLDELGVVNLGVVESATVAFSAGLNVITGETGAGKTLLVEALSLLMGGRAGGQLVGPFGEEARVDGRFAPSPDVQAWLAEAGLDQEGELVVSRRVPRAGSSRAWVNGRPVTAGQLADLGGMLVALHGQHTDQRLLGSQAVRAAVDTRLPEARAAYVAAWQAWQGAKASLGGLGGTPEERAREADLLRYQTGEIEAAAPQPGEREELDAVIDRLGHAQALREAAAAAYASLDGPGGDAMAEAVATLRAAPGASLSTLRALAAGLQDQMADLARDLRAAADSFEDDPAGLEAALARRTVLHELGRKYGVDVGEILAFGARARARLDELEGYETRAAEAAAQEHASRDRRDQEAARLSAARRQAAGAVAAEATGHLAALALPGARIEIMVAPAETGPTGADRVALLFSAHPATPPGPVQKVASGGELSRLMLALELTLRDPATPSLVFDEVDSGVGGATGAAVGALLAELAALAQVLCVTHLPQVAAYAQAHLVMRKEAGTAAVERLDHEGRVAELSRMLAGREESAAARAHAEELMAASIRETAGRTRPARRGSL